MIYAFIILFCAPVKEAVAGELPSISYDSIELNYSTVNADYSPFDDGYGYSLGGSKKIGDIFYLTGNYTHARARIGGDIRSQELSDWWAVGPFAAWAINPRFHLIGGVTVQGAVLDDRTETGYCLQAGFRALPLRHVEFNLFMGYLDVVIKDIQTIGEVYYHINETLAVGGRVRDYADWDYTCYDVGLRYSF